MKRIIAYYFHGATTDVSIHSNKGLFFIFNESTGKQIGDLKGYTYIPTYDFCMKLKKD